MHDRNSYLSRHDACLTLVTIRRIVRGVPLMLFAASQAHALGSPMGFQVPAARQRGGDALKRRRASRPGDDHRDPEYRLAFIDNGARPLANVTAAQPASAGRCDDVGGGVGCSSSTRQR
jgi:hypothetical protein